MPIQIVKLLGNPINIVVPDGVNWLGAYVAETAYVVGDSVSYNGSSYVAVQSTTGNAPTDTTYWQVLANKGDTGETGETGAAGTNGTDGADGVGVPTGGTTNQVLAKSSNTNFDTQWVDNTGGAGISAETAIAYAVSL